MARRQASSEVLSRAVTRGYIDISEVAAITFCVVAGDGREDGIGVGGLTPSKSHTFMYFAGTLFFFSPVFYFSEEHSFSNTQQTKVNFTI